jgi:hypothetical protein
VRVPKGDHMLDIAIACEVNTDMKIPESLGLGIPSDVVHGVPGHHNSRGAIWTPRVRALTHLGASGWDFL